MKTRLLIFLMLTLLALGQTACGGIETYQTPPNSVTTQPSPSEFPTALTRDSLAETSPEPSAYWPIDGWRTSTPEEQGLDSDKLADMLETILEEEHNIHSVAVVRNGHLVMDAYIYPFREGEKHIIHSCTKSVVSALIGIAIDQGFIDSVETPLLDLFPTKDISNFSADKGSITLKDLLTMSSGLECRDSYLYNWRGLDEMRGSYDWTGHMLNLPMAESPGTRFEYCNGGSYLLSAIVQASTGMTSLGFAMENLFKPLGISDVDWPASPQGVNIGWGEMRLAPLDMAKFGYLILHQGEWDGQQILSADWVRESTSPQVQAGTLSDSYGYQWWVDEKGYVMALGYAGQYIVVLPERNMVVVFTSGLAPEDFFLPERFLNSYILPAVLSDEPLPQNQPASSRLEALVELAASPPEPAINPKISETAMEISGRTYVFDDGATFRNFRLDFEGNSARFQLTWAKTIEVDIGLDNRYALTDSAGYLRAYKGSWLDDSTFRMEYQIIGYSENGSWDIIFDGDQARATFRETTTGQFETMIAHHQN